MSQYEEFRKLTIKGTRCITLWEHASPYKVEAGNFPRSRTTWPWLWQMSRSWRAGRRRPCGASYRQGRVRSLRRLLMPPSSTLENGHHLHCLPLRPIPLPSYYNSCRYPWTWHPRNPCDEGPSSCSLARYCLDLEGHKVEGIAYL